MTRRSGGRRESPRGTSRTRRAELARPSDALPRTLGVVDDQDRGRDRTTVGRCPRASLRAYDDNACTSSALPGPVGHRRLDEIHARVHIGEERPVELAARQVDPPERVLAARDPLPRAPGASPSCTRPGSARPRDGPGAARARKCPRVTSGQSTGSTMQMSFAAARSPATTPKTGARSSTRRRLPGTGARAPPRFPTASTSSQTSWRTRQPLRERLAAEKRERLRRAEPLRGAADEENPHCTAGSPSGRGTPSARQPAPRPTAVGGGEPRARGRRAPPSVLRRRSRGPKSGWSSPGDRSREGRRSASPSCPAAWRAMRPSPFALLTRLRIPASAAETASQYRSRTDRRRMSTSTCRGP